MKKDKFEANFLFEKQNRFSHSTYKEDHYAEQVARAYRQVI